MKIKRLWPQLVSSLIVLMLAAGCQKSSDSKSDEGPTYTDEDIALLNTFTSEVVIPTYKSLDDKALALYTALVALRDAPSQANFTAAKEAWLASRVPWEQSEGFLTGPVDSQGLDPAMDTWPVKPDLINNAVAEKGSDNTIVDLSAVEVDAKGYHAIEYLLFGEAGAKTFADLTAKERSYLVSLANGVHQVTSTLLENWTESFDGGDSYAKRLLNSGVKEGGVFATSHAAIADIVEKMAGIAEEVGTGKIGGPHAQDVDAAIESEYSDNSLVDFENNVLSLRHVYRGSLTGAAVKTSISARVKAKDAALDTKVETTIDEAIAAIREIPYPFRVSATDAAADAKITAAEEKLRDLRDLVNNSVAEAVN